MLYFKYILY